MTYRAGSPHPWYDLRGIDTNDDTRTEADELNFLGKPQSGQTGAAASIIAGAAAGSMRVSGLTGMTIVSRHRFLTITGAASGANNGTFLIANFVDANNVDVVNASAVIPDANNGAISWVEREVYSLQDNFQFRQTGERLIKGTASYADAIPTYERPDAIGTPVSANLTNLAGNTLDSKAVVDNLILPGVLRPSITGLAGTVAIADETLTTTNFHFTANDLDSFVTLTEGTATGAAGTYRIKAVTDGQTVELDGLNPSGAGTVTAVLEPDLKGLLTSIGYADAVNRLGVPIADSGAEDETEYAATFADVIDTNLGGGIVEEDGDRIFARSFGDEVDPNATVTNEGTRVFVQLYTGPNTGAATVSLLEPIAGRNGAAASLTNGSTNVTGLTGMVSEDVGRYLTIWDVAVDGNQRHALITSVVSATEVTVAGANFATDANDGSIRWQVSRHSGALNFYVGNRVRADQRSETAGRTTLIGGIISDSELVQDIAEIRQAMGIADGVDNLSGLLTNTGANFVFSDLPDAEPSVVEALNTLNAQIGDRTYTGSILTSGETVAASLQALSNAVSSASVVRVIQRITVLQPGGTPITIPGGNTYTPDGTNNGQNMDVHISELLKDPGPATTGSNSYEETSITQITPYKNVNPNTSINYHIRQ